VRLSPRLPDWLSTVRVSNLRVGDQHFDLTIDKHDGRNEVFMSGTGKGITLQIV
jgi:hypothetical protein